MHASEILAALDYGWYINPWKAGVLVLVLLVWAKLLTWADKDADDAHLPRAALNSAFLGGLIVAFFLFLMLPGFALALTVFLVVWVAEIAAYLVLRKQKVGLGDLSKQFKDWIGGFTKRSKGPKIAEGDVALLDKKGSTFAPPDEESPDFGAYNAAQSLFGDPLRRGAERIELRPTEGAAAVKYWVDGVSIEGRAIAKEDAASTVTLLKRLTGLDVNDRRKPQQGNMKVLMAGKKREIQVRTAGSTAGESLNVEIEPKKRHDLKINEIGLADDQLALMEETIGSPDGIVLVAAPKGHGQTALLYAILRKHDAFLSHIQTLEREAAQDLEGITQNKVPAGPGEEAKLMSWVGSQEPDILMVDKIEEQKAALELIKFVGTGKRAYLGVRAGGVFEALQQWRTMVGDDKAALKNLKLIIAARLVRKLCPACKADYNPDPETLRKMNMAPEKVGKLFTARSQPLRDAKGREMVCEFCLDLHFKGRVGVYEMFVIDDEVRQVIAAGGSTDRLKMVFKKQRRKYLPEMALARAIAGDTSLQEVARVMRAESSSSSSSHHSSKKSS